MAKEWSELNHVEITPEMINCVGCRIEGIKTPFCGSMCEIRKCAMSRNYETCGDCAEKTSCKKLAMVSSNNEEARKKLNI